VTACGVPAKIMNRRDEWTPKLWSS
jgi:hypothetical protein